MFCHYCFNINIMLEYHCATHMVQVQQLVFFCLFQLIDLKAELFRKQEEFKAQKLQSQNTGFIKGKPSTSNKVLSFVIYIKEKKPYDISSKKN